MTWDFERLLQRFRRPRRPRRHQKQARPKRWNGTCRILSVGPARAAQAGQERPQIANTHVELKFDETLNRIVEPVVDESTGETIHEIPPEQLKALYTKMRELLGPLVDGTA